MLGPNGINSNLDYTSYFLPSLSSPSFIVNIDLQNTTCVSSTNQLFELYKNYTFQVSNIEGPANATWSRGTKPSREKNDMTKQLENDRNRELLSSERQVSTKYHVVLAAQSELGGGEDAIKKDAKDVHEQTLRDDVVITLVN
jgi:multidrug efflux pump subunit AcrB